MKLIQIVLRMSLPILLVMTCSIKAPEVSVTGDKTALEREVVGTYHQLEEDTWMIASTRAASKEEQKPISSEKREVLEAMQRQKFNRDDIDELKRKGVIGENSQGFLTIRSSQEISNDPKLYKLAQDVVTEENEDREVIMGRVIELNHNLKNAVRKNIMAIFAQMNQENSPVGTWVERQVGDWVKK